MWSKIKQQTEKTIKTDISQFHYVDKQNQCSEYVFRNLKFMPNSTPQEKCTSITETCTSAAKNILGPKPRQHKLLNRNTTTVREKTQIKT